MATPPTVFADRYEIVREIAHGGMADVYLARDSKLNRPVALKVLSPELSRDPMFVERFRREAQSAAGLNQPNIVGIFDWGQEHGTSFIVMEYIDGRTLRDMIRADGVIAPGADRRHRRRHRGGARVRAQERRRAPGREAGQRAHHHRGPGEGHRLRDRPGRRQQRRAHPHRRGDGHRDVLLARAGPGPPGRRPLRRLLARRRPLRDGDGRSRRSPATRPVSVAYKHVREEVRRRRASRCRRSRPSSSASSSPASPRTRTTATSPPTTCAPTSCASGAARRSSGTAVTAVVTTIPDTTQVAADRDRGRRAAGPARRHRRDAGARSPAGARSSR